MSGTPMLKYINSLARLFCSLMMTVRMSCYDGDVHWEDDLTVMIIAALRVAENPVASSSSSCRTEALWVSASRFGARSPSRSPNSTRQTPSPSPAPKPKLALSEAGGRLRLRPPGTELGSFDLSGALERFSWGNLPHAGDAQVRESKQLEQLVIDI